MTVKFSDRSILEYIERNVINNPEKIAIIKMTLIFPTRSYGKKL